MQRASRGSALGLRSCTVAVAIMRPAKGTASGLDDRSMTVAADETSTAVPDETLRDAVGPAGPVVPSDPAGPIGPVAPLAPRAPSLPSKPSLPRAPGGPEGPGGPGVPACFSASFERCRPPSRGECALRLGQRPGRGAARGRSAHGGADRAGEQHDQCDAKKDCERPHPAASGDPCQDFLREWEHFQRSGGNGAALVLAPRKRPQSGPILARSRRRSSAGQSTSLVMKGSPVRIRASASRGTRTNAGVYGGSADHGKRARSGYGQRIGQPSSRPSKPTAMAINDDGGARCVEPVVDRGPALQRQDRGAALQRRDQGLTLDQDRCAALHAGTRA